MYDFDFGVFGEPAPPRYPIVENWGEVKKDPENMLPRGTMLSFAKGKYEVLSFLGDGSYGAVFRVSDGRTECAAKLGKIPTTPEAICKEMEIMNAVRSVLPEVPGVYECGGFTDDKNPYVLYEYMIFQLFINNCAFLITSMMQQMEKSGVLHEEKRKSMIASFVCTLCFVFRELARQIGELELHRIYHIDIKLQNMLYRIARDSQSGEPYFVVSLADYGVTCDLNSSILHKRCESVASWVPPEWKYWQPSIRRVENAQEIMLAQCYMVGRSIAHILDLQTFEPGSKVIDLMKELSPSRAASLQQLCSVDMVQHNPEHRPDNAYQKVVFLCDEIVRDIANQRPRDTAMIVRSINHSNRLKK